MSPIIAIDIETTGLDPKKDAITEIGAVKFEGKRVEAEWSSLVNPGMKIPPYITQLTGIDDNMVRNAPRLEQVLPELVKFAGNDPVIGHNVRFDLGFLQKRGILKLNEVIDTYDMAAVLLPASPRYNLGTLGKELLLTLPNSHRALDDAKLTHAVYFRLYEKAISLPVDILAEIVRQGDDVDWDGRWIFRQILRARIREPLGAMSGSKLDYGAIFGGVDILSQPLEPNKEIEPLDVEEVSAMLEHGGAFAQKFEGFEQRPQQLEMLRGVTRALSEGQHLMVEAGTGTGKSMAYLLPAALFATRNNARVVISTNTINLQDQLIQKDIPDLRKALGLDLRAVVLKGRSNYLCPRRLETLRQRGPDSAEAVRVLGKVLVWLRESGSGDRSDLTLNGPGEREVWSTKLSAEDEGCDGVSCVSRMGGACPFFRARQAAQSAHIIIVNHALLLADVVTGNRVLPEYQHLIVDEAHHLEDASTSALGFRVTETEISRLLRELGGTSSGVLGTLLKVLTSRLRPSDLAAFQDIIQKSTDHAFNLEQRFHEFFQTLDEFLENVREGNPVGSYGQQTRVTPATRTLPAWASVDMIWDETGDSLSLLIDQLNRLQKGVGETGETSDEDLQDAVSAVANLARRLTEISFNLDNLVAKPDPNAIYWAEIQSTYNGTQKLALNTAPLHVGDLLEKYLWFEKSSVILTSATLTTWNTFDYLRNRLNAREANELMLGSPFDYENSALLYLVNDIPEPSVATQFQNAVDNTLIQLARATGGRMLVLFTSYAQLKNTSARLSPALSRDEIYVYEQGEGASASALLDTFKETEKAVLLGTRSFWEGVDVPGESLSVVVIVKLPFDVPSDPIVAARSETYENPFNEYNIPEAVLRFRQGFGRLIRSQSDRGMVVVLDRRLLTKSYRNLFLESLPDCKKMEGRMEDLPSAAKRWLNL